MPPSTDNLTQARLSDRLHGSTVNTRIEATNLLADMLVSMQPSLVVNGSRRELFSSIAVVSQVDWNLTSSGWAPMQYGTKRDGS